MRGPAELQTVGRREQLEQILRLLAEGAQSRGGVVLLEAETGMGKTSLVRGAEARCRQHPGLEEVQFVWTRCDMYHGAMNPFQPFADLLGEIASLEKPPNLLNRVLGKMGRNRSTIVELAQEMANIVPTVGPAAKLAIKTGNIAATWLASDDQSRSAPAQSLVKRYVDTILQSCTSYTPLVMVVEDAHWMDEMSCQLLWSLGRAIQNRPIVLLVSYRPTSLSEKHPLREVSRQLKIERLAREIVLHPFNEDDIKEYMRLRYNRVAGHGSVARLHQLTGGSPMVLEEYLKLLEEKGVIPGSNGGGTVLGEPPGTAADWDLTEFLTETSVPPTVQALLESRIEAMESEYKAMLQRAAVQGPRFIAYPLAEQEKLDQIDVLAKLREVEQRHRVISYSAPEDWGGKKYDGYAFEHLLMHHSFYDSLSPGERREHHRVLAQILAEAAGENALPRKLILEIARHNEAAEEYLAAARYSFEAAYSAFLGGALVEAEGLAWRALDSHKKVAESSVETDELLAQVVYLILAASETRWRVRTSSEDREALLSLVHEAEEAAHRVGDSALLAQIKLGKGKLFMSTGTMLESLSTMAEALEHAVASGDPFTEFLVKAAYGHHLVKEDIQGGLKLQYEALELHRQKLAHSPAPYDRRAIDRAGHRIIGFIGVGEFDRGDYGAAYERLNEGLSGLLRLKLDQDVVVLSNCRPSAIMGHIGG